MHHRAFIPFIVANLLAVGIQCAEAIDIDISNLGGDLSTDFTDRDAIQVPAPNITTDELRVQQVDGFEVFHIIKNKQTGLGPFFNSNSCGRCHINNGRGKVKFSQKRKLSTMVIKVALKGLNDDSSPRDVPKVGEQLLDITKKGKLRYQIKLTYKSVNGNYADGTPYKLRKPKLRFVIGKKKEKFFAHSLRMTPMVIGPGLLEAIDDSTILGFADPNDMDSDGISGKVQYVPDRKTDTLKIGRFGFRASHPTLEQQSAAAAFHDMGVINSLFNPKGKSLELSDEDLSILSIYQVLASMPKARDQNDPEVISGKAIFSTIGCDDCHKMNITTGAHLYTELSNQVIHPFTDLLLHDMGEGLADTRAEFEASGSEFRTTPLWGLGFSETLSKVKANFLHDGRARTIEEAILWHGGEAESSQEQFKNLSKVDRDAILRFLRSL